MHKLSEEKAELFPVDQYAVQELPLRRLQQSAEASSMRKCQSCGEQTPIAAWCEKCDGIICQQCVTLHKKISGLSGHSVVEKKANESEDSMVKNSKTLSCLKHTGENLKYLCMECSELVCAECILMAHRYHKYSTAEEARHNLEIKMEELASLAVTKKEEFNDYLKKVKIVENEAIECSEYARSAVNRLFDVIADVIEMQRNKALQSVSEGVKKIWSQKNMMEVRIAQVDSFVRFVDHTHKCTTSTSYVAMATQAIRLIEELKDAHGDEDTLDYKMVTIGAPLHLSVPLDGVVKLGQPMFEFTPASGSRIILSSKRSISVTVSLKVQGLPILLSIPFKTLDVKARQNSYTVCTSVKLLCLGGLSWKIVAQLPTEGLGAHRGNKLTISCTIAGNRRIKPGEVTYKLKTLPQTPPPPSAPCSEGSKANVPARDTLTLQQLSLIEELLYGKIYNLYPQLAGKITGIL